MKTSIVFNPDNVTAVMLNDGWYGVSDLAIGSHGHLGNGILCFQFTDENGDRITGPMTAVQAFKTA